MTPKATKEKTEKVKTFVHQRYYQNVRRYLQIIPDKVLVFGIYRELILIEKIKTPYVRTRQRI